MSRMYLKNKKRIRIKKLIVIMFIIFLLLIFIMGKLTKKVSSYILEYSKMEVIKYTTNIISNSMDIELLNNKELYKITKNKSDEIEMIDYDTYVVNGYLKEVIETIELNLKKVDNSIIFYIPLGSVFQNVALNNIGPNIPIKIKLVGAISANVETKVKEYGINNSLIEMVINIELKERVVLPIISDVITIKSNIPISYKIIKGKIPNYYGSSWGKNSSIYSVSLE